MPLNWDTHKCTYYCQGPIHAIPLLVAAGVEADEIIQLLTTGFAEEGEGMALLSVRPALEADVKAWRSEIFQDCEGWRSDGSHSAVSAAATARMTVPFLAFIRLKEEGKTDDPA